MHAYLTTGRRLLIATCAISLTWMLASLPTQSRALAAQPTTVIDFEKPAPGTPITNQYEPEVDFNGFASTPGFRPLVVQVAPGIAQSGDHVASISNCGGGFNCEFFEPMVTGVFGTLHSQVSLYAGDFSTDPNATATLTLTVFDANKNVVGTDTVTVTGGSGFHSLLSVTTATPQIAYFQLAAPNSIDASLGFDDLTLDNSPPSQPDFNISSSQPNATLLQGGSATITLLINRFGNSNGSIRFDISGLPTGVSASFSPNPVDSSQNQAVLTLNASINAPPIGLTPAGITATPLSTAAGLTSKPLTIGISVQSNFSLSAPASADITACKSPIRITVERNPAFSDTVNLSLQGLPTGFASDFAPQSLTFPGGELLDVSTLLIIPPPGVSAEGITITVTAASGPFMEQTPIHLTGRCSRPPFDLIASQFDPNGFPINPMWYTQTLSPPKPPSLKDCDARLPNESPCTSQATTTDFNETKCPNGSLTGVLYPGHINWTYATFTGQVMWNSHSDLRTDFKGSDDDYNIELINPLKPGLTAANPGSLHMEFDSDETIDHFATSWWKTFHSAVDSSDSRTLVGGRKVHHNGRTYTVGGHFLPYTPAQYLIDGHDAVAFGMFGLDCAHSCGSELHPVMFLAIRIENPPTSNNDRWAIFVRNTGNEGYCSSGIEHVNLPVLSFILPPPDRSVTSMSVTKTEFLTRSRVTAPSVKFVCQGGGPEGAQISFGMPPWQNGDFADGVLTLSWAHQKSANPPCRPAAFSPPLGAIHLHASPVLGGEYPETRIEALVAGMTPRQRQIYNRLRPRIIHAPALVVPTQAGPPAPAPPPQSRARGITLPARPAPDPGLAAYNRGLAHALLRAYGGKLPPYIRPYIVRQGDTLTSIAARFNLVWQIIFEANNFRIKNPNLIYPGQVFGIP